MPLLSKGELRDILGTEIPEALDRRWAAPSHDEATGGHEATGPVLAVDDAIVKAEHLAAVAVLLRDKYGYEYLSNITVIDYLQANLIEVLYQFYNLEGGADVRVRVRVGRGPEECIIPSLTPIWPGADLQEREAFDMYGVIFPGHPHLERIYLWDEFKGFPMRKDFPKTGDKYTHVTGE